MLSSSKKEELYLLSSMFDSLDSLQLLYCPKHQVKRDMEVKLSHQCSQSKSRLQDSHQLELPWNVVAVIKFDGHQVGHIRQKQ